MKDVDITNEVRILGIPVVKEAHWGTHFCQFYKSKKDLIDILVPYVKTGLTNNECCIWITSEPLLANEAKEALQKEVENLAQFINKGQIEILDYSEWYTKSGKFEGDKVLHAWVEKEKEAIKKGFDGLRITGNMSWLEKCEWKKFAVYERKADKSLETHRIIALCAYSLTKCDPSEILDVVNNHQFALVRKGSKWGIIESSGGKQTRRALEELEEKYRTIVENAQEGIGFVDPKENIMFVNQGFAKILGYKREELIGRNLKELTSREEFDKYLGETRQRKRGTKSRYETFLYNNKGQPRYLSVSAAPQKKKTGAFQGTIGVVMDITEQKMAEAKLRESEAKLKAIFEGVQDGILAAHPETKKFVFANPAICEMTGYTENELLKLDINKIHPPEDLSYVLGEVKKQIAGDSTLAVNLPVLRKDKKIIYCDVNAKLAKINSHSLLIGIFRDVTERKKAETEIREAKEYAENITSSMVDALIVLDTEGKIQSVNKSICDLLNCKKNELIGQSFGMLIAEEEEEEEEVSIVDKRFRKLLRKGPVIDYNTSFSTKTSEKIPVSIYGSIIRDEKGRLTGVVLTARDMRARIASENKIKESEERYRGVVENLTDAIFLLDEQGKFVHMNRPGIKLYGWKKLGDIAERNFVEDAHRKYSGVLAKAVETAWSGKMAECHYESTTNGGLHKWWEVTLVPLRDASGKILNIVGISRDVTLKKQSEQLIKFYKEYAEHIVANLPISILILNREIEINFANQHFIKRLGKSREEVMDKPLEEVLGRAYKGIGFDEKIMAVIKGDETMPRGRFELRGKYYDYQILRFKERIGRRFNAMFIMEDITERIHLEEQIRDAEKMSAIGQFTAGIAHEINNPLGIILANIQYLTSNMDKIDFTDKKQVNDLNEVLETIGEQSRRCGEIVSNLLHFTHRGRGEEESVNIDKVVRRTMQMMEHQLRLSKIEYTVDLDGNLPVMRGDVNRLQQVFVNLILNAQHAMTSGGKLHIKTFVEDNNWICITFRDTGPGIPRKHQKRIFEPFYTTRKAGEGTGLGLSVVRSIIQEHGGTINVDSKRGAGATFKIALPVAKKGLFGLWK